MNQHLVERINLVRQTMNSSIVTMTVKSINQGYKDYFFTSDQVIRLIDAVVDKILAVIDEELEGEE